MTMWVHLKIGGVLTCHVKNLNFSHIFPIIKWQAIGSQIGYLVRSPRKSHVWTSWPPGIKHGPWNLPLILDLPISFPLKPPLMDFLAMFHRLSGLISHFTNITRMDFTHIYIYMLYMIYIYNYIQVLISFLFGLNYCKVKYRPLVSIIT